MNAPAHPSAEAQASSVASSAAGAPALRSDWSREEISELFTLPFNDLLFRAQTVHRQYFDPNEVQVSTLLSIKTGACPEDCAYCPQSTRFDTGLSVEALMEVENVVEQAKAAREAGVDQASLADLLIGDFVLPFEAVSLLLLAALIGSLVLVRPR